MTTHVFVFVFVAFVFVACCLRLCCVFLSSDMRVYRRLVQLAACLMTRVRDYVALIIDYRVCTEAYIHTCAHACLHT